LPLFELVSGLELQGEAVPFLSAVSGV